MANSQDLVRLEDPSSFHVMPSANNQLAVTNSKFTQPEKKRKKVLEEDDYVSALEQIIERDYFPHLPKLRAQLAYLQSTEKFDINVLKSIYSNFSTDSMFPKMRVSTLVGDDLDPDEKSTTLDPNYLTVSSFFDRYTSEDNKSFEKIEEKNLKEYQRKFHWLYENMDHLLLTDRPTTNHKSILNCQQQEPSNEQAKKAGMLMLYYIGDKILTVEERQKMDAILDKQNDQSVKERMNHCESWPFRVRNQLFFQPELSDTCQVPIIANESSTSNNNVKNGSNQSNQRSILPAPHIPVDMNQLLLHSATSLDSSNNANNSQLVVHNGNQAKQSQNFNNRPDKIIQKNNTNLDNHWFLSMPPPAPRIPTRSTGSFGYESFDSDTDNDSVRGKQQKEQTLINKNKRYRPVEMDMGSVHSFSMAPPTAAPLHTLSDEQLLKRYQELSNKPLQSNIQFSLIPTSQREVAGRKMDKPGKALWSVYGLNDTSSIVSARQPRSSTGTITSQQTGRSGATSVYSNRKKISDLTPAAQALAAKLQKRRESL